MILPARLLPAIPTVGSQVVPSVAAVASVDVVVDGQTRLTSVAYGVPSSPIALSLGQHQVRVVPTGTAPSAGGTTVDTACGRHHARRHHRHPERVDPRRTRRHWRDSRPGKGKLRVIHLATGAPAIDVYRTQPDFATFVKFMDPFPYGEKTPFMESTPGNWVIRVTTKGTTQVLTESAPIRVDALWIRTVLLLDAPNGGVKITPLGDQ